MILIHQFFSSEFRICTIDFISAFHFSVRVNFNSPKCLSVFRICTILSRYFIFSVRVDSSSCSTCALHKVFIENDIY